MFLMFLADCDPLRLNVMVERVPIATKRHALHEYRVPMLGSATSSTWLAPCAC